MDDKKIQQGSRITKKFSGGQFSELSILRKSVKLLLNTLDYDSLTDEEKIIYDNFEAYNNKVQSLLNN